MPHNALQAERFMIDREVQRELDLRLAKGEITKEEYLSIQNTISSSPEAAAPLRSALRSTLASVSRLKDQVFGSNEFANPKNDEPLVVNSEMVLYGDYLEFKNSKIYYSEIESVWYHAYRHVVNYVPIRISTCVVARLPTGREISASASSMVMTGKKNKLVQNAYAVLSSRTFEKRLQRYLDPLESMGVIDFGGVRLYRNGDIEKDGLRLNLKEARKKKALAIGTWAVGEEDPDNIIIGEKGLSCFSRRIRFNVAYSHDKDLIKALLKWLSQDE
jgi:hypothetical protein